MNHWKGATLKDYEDGYGKDAEDDPMPKFPMPTAKQMAANIIKPRKYYYEDVYGKDAEDDPMPNIKPRKY